MKSMINYMKAKTMNNHTFLNHINYNENGYYLHKRRPEKTYQVTVVLPVCNNEATLASAIDSVLRLFK